MLNGRDVDGLVIGMAPVDNIIKLNDLKPVTNPIYLNGTMPTADGVLSYEIFGVGEDRRHRMGYIELGGYHFMNPVAAIKLNQYDRQLGNILFSKKNYIFKDGELIEDDENGQSGPEFLYQIWDKIKLKEKDTIITQEIEETYRSIPKDELFMSKYLVIPAGYRDINTSSSSRVSTHEINDLYSKLIAYSTDLSRDDGFQIMNNITASRIQGLLIEIYTLLVIQKVKGQPSKNGHYKRYVVSKNLTYTARSVISAPELNVESEEDMLIKFSETGVPLAQFCALFYPFVSNWLKNFFDNEFNYGGKYPLGNDKGEIEYVKIDNTYDEVFIQNIIDIYIGSPDSRFDPIPIPYVGPDKKTYHMKHKGRFYKDNTTIDRFMTWTDLLYIAAYDISQTKIIDVTRYPVTSENSQFASKCAIMSTKDTIPVIIGDKVYRHYPVVPEDKSDINNVFVDTLVMSNVYAAELGADYDGDQVSEKSRFTIEANEEGFKQINSKLYYLSINGNWMRPLSREFVLTAYMLTKNNMKLQDINKVAPKYKI